MTHDHEATLISPKKRLTQWSVRILALIGFIYLMSSTSGKYYADTIDYVGSINHRLNGVDSEFIEVGHVLWRPVGLLCYKTTSPFLENLFGLDRAASITWNLVALNWISLFIIIAGFHHWIRAWGAGLAESCIISFGLCMSFGLLNYAHTGTSYLPGLASLMVSLILMERPGGSIRTDAAAGLALAISVGFWAPYVLALPMAIAYPLVSPRIERRIVRRSIVVAASLATGMILIFGAAVFAQGIRDLPGLIDWLRSSSHGIVRINGLARALFGMPRSFIDLGNDGWSFKRYLLKDPYAPTGLLDLAGQSIAKMGFFYLAVIAAIGASARDAAGRRLLLLLVLSGIPTVAFAVYWQGGDVERYFPIYLTLFITWALTLSMPKRFLEKSVIGLFLATMTITNAASLSKSAISRHNQIVDGRLASLLPKLGPMDHIYLLNSRDPCFRSSRENPHKMGRSVYLRLLIDLGHEDTALWRGSFAADVIKSWTNNQDVWISTRVLQTRPRPEWGWIEGEDPRIAWAELAAYFSELQFSEPVGGLDGFIFLERSPWNRKRLQEWL